MGSVCGAASLRPWSRRKSRLWLLTSTISWTRPPSPSAATSTEPWSADLPIERAVSAGRIAAYNADKHGRDWGVPVLYLRAADGMLFEGAPDAETRRKAKSRC